MTFHNTIVVIGAMKSGTSSLHSYLDLHPQISMSRTKELNFFVAEKEHWAKGFGWYDRQLGSRKATWRGESSPNYTKHPTFPGVPERMFQVMPDARLIYVLRDPISRIVSHYVHNRSHGRESKPIDAALANPQTNDYVYPSRYHYQIERFVEAGFTMEQLLVLDQRRLKNDRRAVMRECFDFIGVDASFDHPGFERELHHSSRKGQPTSLARRLMRYPGGRALRYALPQIFEEPLERPALPDGVRDALAEVLAPDAAALRQLTGLDFEGWSV